MNIEQKITSKRMFEPVKKMPYLEVLFKRVDHSTHVDSPNNSSANGGAPNVISHYVILPTMSVRLMLVFLLCLFA